MRILGGVTLYVMGFRTGNPFHHGRWATILAIVAGGIYVVSNITVVFICLIHSGMSTQTVTFLLFLAVSTVILQTIGSVAKQNH